MSKKVIVDIDGTIAKVGGRIVHIQKDKPDWDLFYEGCFEDAPIREVIELVLLLAYHYEIVFCTGRRESVRDKTRTWLENNLKSKSLELRRCKLLMRADGDFRHDIVVKPELLTNSWIDVDDVAFILEDRDSMVNMWRQLGFTCLQVAKGDF